MQKKIKQAQKYLEWQKPDQAIAELKPTLDSDQIQKEFAWLPHHMMGIALSLKGEHESSANHLAEAVNYDSDQPETYHMLSVNYYNLGKYNEAEKYGQEAVSMKSSFLEAWLNLAKVYREQAKLEEALRCYKKVNKLDPKNADVAYHIGNIYKDLGDFKQAHKLFDYALEVDEDHCKAFLGKADVYKDTRRLEKAEELINEAKEKYGSSTAADVALAEICKGKGDYDRAISIYEELVRDGAENGLLYVNYAICLQEVGRFDESEKNYRHAIELLPDHTNPISNYLMGLHYNPQNEREYIFEEHVRLGERFKKFNQNGRSVPSNKSKNKKLKVGFVSGSFKRHPVGFMIVGALEQLSSGRFELYGYTADNKFDFVTRRIHKNIDVWRSIVGYDSKVVEEIIRDDEIDILVDLSGHASHSSFDVMAGEPAPIIVKWVGGLFNTTGIEAFDYLITDRFESPEGEDQYYTEKLVRMPDDYIVFTPPGYAPEVGDLPVLENDYITFGCFNNPTKVNEKIIEQWAKAMLRVGNSKLYLKSKQYDTASFRERVINMFADQGIEKERLLFEGQTSHTNHLNEYNKIDIALDPWPYSGGLTTCEALYMGVPVITMPGPTFAGRHSATHLMNAGLGNWVADNWDEYIEKTVALAQDCKRLAQERKQLRKKIRNSPVCDGKRFGAHLSVAFREMWKQWVEGHKNDTNNWQQKINIEPLTPAKVKALTDGPEEMPLLTPEQDSGGEENKVHSFAAETDKEEEQHTIEIKGDLSIIVPADLEVLSTYVFLEKEEWFEPELDFVQSYLQPGMYALDVGACFGGYALSMAKAVGKKGMITAFEPSARSRSYLEKSKLENKLSQLEVIGRGVSSKTGSLSFKEGESPELNQVSKEGEQKISVTTLDGWWNFAGQPEVEMIKVDVNGMEADVLKGASEMLAGVKPVVIASAENSEGCLDKLQEDFLQQDYRLYEYIPGPGVLAEYDSETGIDPYRMNLVAIAEDRVQEFKEAGWIFDEDVNLEATDQHRWKQMLESQPWAEHKIDEWADKVLAGTNEEYIKALNLVCTAEQIEISEKDSKSRSRKGAMMLTAAQKLIGLFNSGQAGIAAALTYVRVMSQLGKQRQAMEMMKQLMETVNSGKDISVQLPFLPPLPEQDQTVVKTTFPNWLTVRVVEAWIMLKNDTTHESSKEEQQMLKALEDNPEILNKVEKRILLIKRLNGEKDGISKINWKGRNGWFWNRIAEEQKGITKGETVNAEDNTPSQVIEVSLNYDYLGGGRTTKFRIPEKELFRLRNIFDDHEYSLPGNYGLQDNAVIVDIGANIGAFALYARQWNQLADIYCFEPNPLVRSMLKANTENIARVTTEFCALGESEGELTLFQHPYNTGATTTSHKVPGANEVNVEVKKASEALKEKGIKGIDVLKIDTEGAEIPILKGMEELLVDTKIIMLEYHSEEDRRDIDELLDDFCIYDAEVPGLGGVGTVKYINKQLLSE
ncbi:FkbM family methyltransferase [Fodinibius salsisoli]|uniref:protein O-GlcNAc transferase n=1 Tax=Fodinibius salsisoli TaxID=2820877 RepID=A0ABT3PHT6_9BACT|nr:FkbM family methyltransferase [Fodinibius salsisoli]MCW9705343.1 FkbM family methyltransferase [Fodinibius salsisoli]